MLITRWNEASRALPVLAYLDRWPNDSLVPGAEKERLVHTVALPVN